MIQLQAGGKASNANCTALGTNLVRDFRCIQLSQGLTAGGILEGKAKCHRKRHCDSDNDIPHPESAKPCWGALLQVGPRSEPRPPHAVKYRMTLVTRIAAPAQTAGYTANRVITVSSGCFNCPWFVLLNCPLLGLCHVTDTPAFLGVTGFAWCPRELPRFQ